ncbi:Mg2+ transporter protein, CorA-like/Zinc transport protein ZntB [Penicillium expansum]|nr:Mg2+ transporter protein, CorA-like/Zinc transport protein ZntB [Penicillium expansum]KGO51835.1 Mg2+ transporter protein, CorA-like/Zinc transport protein ZntB [Penicillium expansum]
MSSEPEVHSYLDECFLDEFDIIVVAFAKPTATNHDQLQLPISLELFERVSQALEISPALLGVVHTGLASFIASPRTKSGASVQENEQLLIQQTRSLSSFSMGVTKTKTGQTRILIFGAQAWSLSELFDYLESADASLAANMSISIPASALELQAWWFTGTMNSLKSRIRTIENTTGMRKPINHEDLQQSSPHWQDLDMVPLLGELSSLLSRLSFLKMQAETALYLIQRMQQYTEGQQYSEAVADKTVEVHQFPSHEDQKELLVKLENARGWYLGLVTQGEYLMRRTSAQTDTIHSLLASQNSIVNIDIARASNAMAELSRSDNQAMLNLSELSRRDAKLMIEIARDSRSVALSTARDSASMKVLAVVTVLFLPATFTATFFSMTFFSFLGQGGPEVSPWIWIYVAATGLLTAIIQVIWAIMSRRSQASLLSESDGKVEGLQTPP